MQLLTPELERRFAEVGNQDGLGFDALVIAKFFDPCGSWSWFATEFDAESREFFGYVRGHESEWGSFSLDEMEAIKGPLGIGLERDLSFTERPLRDALERDHHGVRGG